MVAGLSLDQRSGGLAFLTGIVAVTALVALVAALVVGGGRLIGAALALLGLLYFVHVLLIGELGPWVLATVGVGMLLVGELAQWSLDSRPGGSREVGMHLSRIVGIAWLVVLASSVVVLALVAASAPAGDGVVSLLLATVGSVTLLALILAVGRRTTENQEPLVFPGVPRDQ